MKVPRLIIRPFRGLRLLRRLLKELRGIRLALERAADAQEEQAFVMAKSAGYTQAVLPLAGQVDREARAALEEGLPTGPVDVSYMDDQTAGRLLALEEDLTIMLGRAPNEVELERAYRGEGP